MLPIEFLPDARLDFDQSFDWYVARSSRAALRFSQEVDDALARIAQDPARFPLIKADFFECSIKKFPFRIIFRVLQDRIFIVSIAHAKRRPDFWSGRQ